jgi:hypothetical protein
MCEVTADGDVVVGRVRPKNNPLIHRSEVGKPAFHNDLPPLPEGYMFGALLKKDKEGAGDVMLTWQSHQPPAHKASYDFGRDFVSLNKQSCEASCITTKDVREFRKGHDARIKPKVTGSKPSAVPEKLKSDRNHVYGAASEPSEHVADLIQNRYELEWVMEQKKQHEQLQAAEKQEALRKAGGSSPSKGGAVQRRAERSTPTPHPKEYFTLKQFTNVPSRYFTPSPAPQ